MGGTFITTTVDLAQEGNQLIGRSRADANGNLRIALLATESNFALTSFKGSSSGTAVDLQRSNLDIATGVRIDIRGVSGGAAELEGDSGRGSGMATGHITGAITFTDVDGRVSTCSRIDWDLIPF